ncbi:MAG: hypothetical protein AAGB31_16405 [Bdellovibrio sp.]
MIKLPSAILTILLLLPGVSWGYEEAPLARPKTYGSSKGVTCPIAIIPGKSLGPIELGKNISELEVLGMSIKKVQGSESQLIVGRYTVEVDSAKTITAISAEIGDLPNCVKYKRHRITQKMFPQRIAKLFTKCAHPERLQGGSIIACDGVVIGSGKWSGQQKSPSLKVVPL